MCAVLVADFFEYAPVGLAFYAPPVGSLLGRPLLDSLFCGKATAVATVHRTVAKSRLSSPTGKKTIDMSKHVDCFWRPLLDSNQRPAD